MSAGIVDRRDFLRLKDGINKFDPALHYKVLIKGIYFSCRGKEYSEHGKYYSSSNPAVNVYNDNNIISKHWHRRVQYSSFVRINNWVAVPYGSGKNVNKAKKRSREKDQGDYAKDLNSVVQFGQLNHCFRLRLGDDLVDGLAFANITMRIPIEEKKNYHYYVSADDSESINTKQKFVCLNYVDSTAIGISAIHCPHGEFTLGVPMQKPQGEYRYSDYIPKGSVGKRNGIYAEKNADLSKLYMIELHPERLSVSYGTIKDDVDGTKVWEKLRM